MVVPAAALDRALLHCSPEASSLHVEPCDLRRAWGVLHRPQAPPLRWEQRILMLSGLFPGRSSAWVHVLEARLEALRHEAALRARAPGEEAFSLAARAPLVSVDGHPRFAAGSCAW